MLEVYTKFMLAQLDSFTLNITIIRCIVIE